MAITWFSVFLRECTKRFQKSIKVIYNIWTHYRRTGIILLRLFYKMCKVSQYEIIENNFKHLSRRPEYE